MLAARDYIVIHLNGAVGFRAEKAREYPHDQRNQQSVDELERLHDYLQTLPEDHPLFIALDKAWASMGDDDESLESFDSEVFHNSFDSPDSLSRYGFGKSEDPERFCRDLFDRILLHSDLPPLQKEALRVKWPEERGDSSSEVPDG